MVMKACTCDSCRHVLLYLYAASAAPSGHADDELDDEAEAIPRPPPVLVSRKPWLRLFQIFFCSVG